MNNYAWIFIGGVSYAIGLAISTLLMCVLSVFNCKLGDNLSVSEVIIPIVFISALIIFWGCLFTLCVDFLWGKINKKKNVLVLLSLALLVGIVPKLVEALFTHPFDSAFYLHPEYIPLAISGLCVLPILILFSRQKDNQQSGTDHNY